MADISLQKDINLEQATYFSLKGFTDILSFMLSLPLERQKQQITNKAKQKTQLSKGLPKRKAKNGKKRSNNIINSHQV